MSNDNKLLTNFIINHTSDAVHLIEQLPEKEVTLFLNSVTDNIAAMIIHGMDKFKAARIYDTLEKEKKVNILLELPFQVCEILLRLINVDTQNDILNSLPKELSNPLRKVLTYNDNLVGAYIDPFAFTLNENYSVNQSIKKIKKENLVLDSHVNILNNNQLLVGNVDLNKLITAKGNTFIGSIMNSKPPKIQATALISKVKNNPNWEKGYTELPVVNSDGIYMGTISKKVIFTIDNSETFQKTPLFQIGTALGELYKIGLSGILRGITISEEKVNKEE